MAEKKDQMQELYEKFKGMSNFTDDDNEVNYTKSGSVIFDQIISDGKGLPAGKWIQITSESGTGKTHLVLHCAKAFCAMGKKVAYIDDEKGVNQSQLKGIGLDKYLGTKFFVYPLATYEEAEEVMDAIVEDPEIGLVVIDSITGLIPEKMITNSVASCEPGLQARYASTFLIKYRTKISRSASKPTVLLVNQMRTKISFVNTTVGEAGGNAQKYYTDIRLMMKEEKALLKTVDTLEGRKSVKYGVNAKIWATKNRHAAPFIEGIITIIFGKGVSNLAAYQRFLMGEGVLKMAGAGFWTLALPDMEEKKARGTEGVLELIKGNLGEIKTYIDANGGFKLIKKEGEEEE